MSKQRRIGISRFLIVAGVGYSATVLFKNRTFSHFIHRLQFLVKGLLKSSTDMDEVQSENADSTDAQDSASAHGSEVSNLISDDTDHTFDSWEYFEDNFVDKAWKIREILQDDADHTFNTWEYFVDNFIDKPSKIREIIKDDPDFMFNNAEYFVDLFKDKPWKHEFLQEGTTFISADEELKEDEVFTDEKLAEEWW